MSSPSLPNYHYDELPTPTTLDDFRTVTAEKLLQLNALHREPDAEYREKVDDLNDVVILTKPSSSSKDPIELYKIRGTIEAPYERVFALLTAHEHRVEQAKLDPDVVSRRAVKHLDQTETLSIMHTRVHGTFPVSDREFWSVRKLHIDGNTRVMLGFSFNADSTHVESGCVRGALHLIGWIVERTSDARCRVTRIIKVDPKGWIPAMVVNRYKSHNADSFTTLRRLATT